MNSKPLDQYTKTEFEEEIALYKDAGITIPEDLTNNEKRAAFIEQARKDHGYPRRVTAEDIELNKDGWPEDIKEGDVILLPELSDAPEPPEPPAQPSTPPEAPAPQPAATAETSADAEEPEVQQVQFTDGLLYKGRPVIGVENKIVNGVLYKEVRTPEASFLLSEEEFSALDPDHA